MVKEQSDSEREPAATTPLNTLTDLHSILDITSFNFILFPFLSPFFFLPYLLPLPTNMFTSLLSDDLSTFYLSSIITASASSSPVIIIIIIIIIMSVWWYLLVTRRRVNLYSLLTCRWDNVSGKKLYHIQFVQYYYSFCFQFSS